MIKKILLSIIIIITVSITILYLLGRSDEIPCDLKPIKHADKEGKRIIKVAAVQMILTPGQFQENLEHATRLINQAAGEGAELILLPELMATGYILSSELWDSAEPKNGPSVKWLKSNSKRLGVWLGAGFLEAEGEDFYNTFVLIGPDGNEAGRVWKQRPSIAECPYFKGRSSPHVIDTEIGRIGVGICYENNLAFIPDLMHKQSADLLLMPIASAMSPAKTKVANIMRDMVLYWPRLMAETLGIPIVQANHCGRGRQYDEGIFYFPGFSAIIDSDGKIKKQMGINEGIIVTSVTLDPSRKKVSLVYSSSYKYWPIDRSWFLRRMFYIMEGLFRIRYRLSSERKAKALEISSSQ